MKYIMIISLLFSHVLMADLPFRIEDIKCKKEILEQLKKHKSLNQWTRVSDQTQDILNYRTPTQTIGKWLQIKDSSTAALLIYQKDLIKVIEWNKKTCKVVLNNQYPSFSFIKAKRKGLNDDLVQKLKKNKITNLIYISKESDDELFETLQKYPNLKSFKFLKSNFNPIKYSRIKGALPFNSIELIMRNTSYTSSVIFLIGYDKISNKINTSQPIENLIKEIEDENYRLKRKI